MKWLRNIASALLLAGIISGLTLLGTYQQKKGIVLTGRELIVIISPHWSGIRVEFSRAFHNWFYNKTGRRVRVEWEEHGGTSQCLKFVGSQLKRSPSGIGIDIFYGGGVPAFLRLKRMGALEKGEISREVLSRITKEVEGTLIYDPEGYWFGAALSGFGIVYNKNVMGFLGLAEPSSWADLARPELFGWVGSGDPRKSGSVHALYEIILQARGWREGISIIRRIAENVRYFSEGGSDAPELVSMRELACSGAIDLYALAQIEQAEAEEVGFVAPKGEAIVNADPIAILEGAPHPELAKAFVEFVLSPEGQKLWMLPAREPDGPKEFRLNRLSVIPFLYDELKGRSLAWMNPFEAKVTFPFDSKKDAVRRRVLDDYLGVTLIDTHAELSRAWKAIIDAGMPEKPLRLLTDPFFSEEELISLSAKWKESAFRQSVLNRLTEKAYNTYREARRLARAYSNARMDRRDTR